MEGSGLGVELELNFFYFILNSTELTRDVTYSRLYSDGKNMRRQCQINTLLRILIGKKHPKIKL